MKTRKIPDDRSTIIALATEALSGAIHFGDAVGLQQNKAAKIAEILYDLTGTPNPALDGGKQGQLNQIRTNVSVAEAHRREILAESLEFCGTAIDLLKAHLGRRWNPQWAAVGLNSGSIALPSNPLTLLMELRDYFRTHPEHECVNPEATAAKADAMATAFQEAADGVNSAHAMRKSARKERDAALEKLSRTLTGLRTELDQLLPRDDERWYAFGFRRPVDGRTPAPVENLTLRAGPPHGVVAEWNHSARAESYRVTRQVKGVDPEPVEVGICADPTKAVNDLPSGAVVEIRVTARNGSGESAPMIAVFVVPQSESDPLRQPLGQTPQSS